MKVRCDWFRPLFPTYVDWIEHLDEPDESWSNRLSYWPRLRIGEWCWIESTLGTIYSRVGHPNWIHPRSSPICRRSSSNTPRQFVPGSTENATHGCPSVLSSSSSNIIRRESHQQPMIQINWFFNTKALPKPMKTTWAIVACHPSKSKRMFHFLSLLQAVSDMWHAAEWMTGVLDCEYSKSDLFHCQRAIVLCAREYLERSFRQALTSVHRDVDFYECLISFLTSNEKIAGLQSVDDRLVDGVSAWPLIFYALRAGDTDLVMDIIEKAK